MAILKGIGSPSLNKYGSQDVLNYVGEKAELTEGVNCSSNYKEAYTDFQDTKKFFKKEDGRQFLHYVQSFKEGEVTGEEALELTKKFCDKVFKENEVFLAVHTDTKNIHCHIVVNSVSFENGYKFQCSKNDLAKWKEITNEINQEHGLEIPQKSDEIGKIITNNKDKDTVIKKGDSDIANTYLTLVNTLEKNEFTNKQEFVKEMDKNGIIVDWQEQRKNITFEVKKEYAQSKKNKFRLSNLSKTFSDERLTKENLEKYLEKNLQQERIRQKQIERDRDRGGWEL